MKYLISLVFSFIIFCQVYSQGLENIIIEKYYISDSADSVGSIGNLPVGSYTYRIYVDMLPGYKFISAYGTSNHNLKFTTSTTFFNFFDNLFLWS